MLFSLVAEALLMLAAYVLGRGFSRLYPPPSGGFFVGPKRNLRK